MPEDDRMSMPSPRYLEAKKQEARGHLTTVFDEYKKLLRDKTHPDNQGKVYDRMVQKTLQRLLSAADDMDSVTPGEGIFGLIVLSLRSTLRVKDDNVRLEVKIKELEKEVKRLKKQRG